MRPTLAQPRNRQVRRLQYIFRCFTILGALSAHTHVYGAEAPAALASLVTNGDFEAGADSDGVPVAWVLNRGERKRNGAVRVAGESASGAFAVTLEPNKRNDNDAPLSLAQEIPSSGLGGQEIEFSGYLAASAGSDALIGVQTVSDGKAGEFVMLYQHGGDDQWTRQSKRLRVPAGADTHVYLALWASGTSGHARFDQIVVRRADRTVAQAAGDAPAPAAANNAAAAQAAPTAAALPATVHIDAADLGRRIPPTLYGANIEWRWNATSLWREATQDVDPTALSLTRDMGLRLLRYPGGVYSDFYHWRDGVGPREKRPLVVHEAGKPDKSRANFGTDEALEFADRVGAELLITVNAGSGTAEEAADWVRYVNRDRLRVRYWEIGNEIYLNDGSPATAAVTMPPKKYAQTVLAFARAMRAADPRIVVGAIGGINQGSYRPVSYEDWNATLFRVAGDAFDFLAVHNAYAPILTGDQKGRPLRDVYRAMLARPQHIAANLTRVADEIAAHYPDPAKRPFVAITEWGPIFQFFHEGEYVDHAKTLGSALFCASALKAFIESPVTDIANFWMLNDYSVLGWIAPENDDFPPAPRWIPTARYYAFQLYSKHFGTRLVRSSVQGPYFAAPQVGWSDAADAVPYLDVIASTDDNGTRLSVIAINKHFDSPIRVHFTLDHFAPAAQAQVTSLRGAGIDAHTGSKLIKVPGLHWGKQSSDGVDGHFERHQSDDISFATETITGVAREFDYELAPHSAVSIELQRP